MSKHFHKSSAITSDFPAFDEFSAAYDVLNLSEDYDWYANDAEDFVDGFNEMTPDEKYKAVTGLVSAKVQDYYDQLVDFYEGMAFPATLYRVVALSKIEALRMENIGESWTWDEHSAEEFLPGNHGRFMLKASVPYESVDWHETLKLNLDRGIGEVENEVRLKFDAPMELVAYRSKSTKEWTPIAKMVTANNKTAYLSPATGTLDISVIRDSRPYATISLDLGIPNFTVFSLKFPLVEDKPATMSELVAEGVHVLLDEMSAFMLSLGFEEKIIVHIYATVLTCFKGMTGEADSSKSQSAISKDPTVKTFEGTFKLPMEFVNETYDKVVTAAGKNIKRPPVHRHLELTYEKPSKTTVNEARTVIKNFRNRSLKSQPSPLYIIVYDSMGRARGTIPFGPNFKNQLLNQVYKKASVEFTPTVKFDNDIEMKMTNAEGIPKSIFVGDEKYTPVATVSDDMALYSNEKDEYVVKFTDGRCVAFTDFPSVGELRDDNYPVPTIYTNWKMLPKEEVPESSDDGEAVDARGTEVIEGTEIETDPVADLKADDDKNEQLEEGVDELPEGQEKTSAVKAQRYTVVCKAFRMMGAPIKNWNSGAEHVRLIDATNERAAKREALLDLKNSYSFANIEFKVVWCYPAAETKTSSFEDYRGQTKKPHGMSSQSWQAIQRQLKEEEKKFDPDQYIDPLTNLWGKLKPSERKRLVSVLKKPTNKTWNDAYSIIIRDTGMVSLWQAVIAVDPFFPRRGPSYTSGEAERERVWEKIPSRETLIKALQYANPVKHEKKPDSDYDKDFMKALGIMSSKKADHIDDNGYWAGAGGGASGILPICTTTGRVCLAWRSGWVHEGNCWGTIGGAIQQGMSPGESAKKEMQEEVGYHGSIRLIPSFVFTHGKFKYYNFLGLVASEFSLNPMEGGSSNLQFTDETDAIAWFTWDDLQNDIRNNPSDYHSGVLKLLQQSGDQIREICEAASNKG